MKKLIIATAILLLSIAPAMAGNYAKGTLGYFSPAESNYDGTFNLYGAYGLDLKKKFNAPVTAEFGIGYSSQSGGDSWYDYSATVIPITATALYKLPIVLPTVPKVSFNVGAGLGLYFWSVEVDGPTIFPGFNSSYSDDGSDFGFHLQAGADYKLDKQLSLVGELKWSAVDVGDGTSINFGAKYNF